MPPDRGPDPTVPLWRAAQVFRALSCLYALGFQIAVNADLQRPRLGLVLFAVLIGWSVACAVAYLRGFGRRPAWVGTEIAVVVVLVLSTRLVATEAWTLNNQAWPTMLWASNATVSAALQFGPAGGMLTGFLVMLTGVLLKGHVNINLGRDASIVIQLAMGLAVGMAAQTVRRAHAELQRAVRMSAALEERERLSRRVHDGVVQVLALVAKRGREIGGPAAELAELAGEQERALRGWVTSVDIDQRDDAPLIDLRTLLSRREIGGVSLSLPGTAVPLEREIAIELDAAVGNALDNVRLHAGDGARAFVLLEDLGNAVMVSIRDDGVGIAAGRLAEAARQGRAGVSKSIVGRVESLGGTAELHSEPGGGAEWELSVPRTGGGRQR